jgi:hypothetical protein
MMEDYQGLVKVEPAETLPAVPEDILLATVDQAEKKIKAVKRIKELALFVTNENDWKDFGGKPWLQEAGANKVGRLFGISWRIGEPTFELEADGHFSYTYSGFFSMGGAEITAIGERNSRDEFYSKAHGKDIPTGEIDKGDVKKAAYANCIANGVTRMLGIRNMTWEEIKAGGIEQSQTAKVEYQKPEMNGEAQDLRKSILKMLEEMSEKDPVKVLDLLEMATEFTGKDGEKVKGKRDLSKVSEKAMKPTYGRVKDMYEAWLKEHGQPTLPEGQDA